MTALALHATRSAQAQLSKVRAVTALRCCAQRLSGKQTSFVRLASVQVTALAGAACANLTPGAC